MLICVACLFYREIDIVDASGDYKVFSQNTDFL